MSTKSGSTAQPSQGDSHDALLAKQWRYDAAGEVIQKGDQRYGVVSYRDDPTGRIEQATGAACRR